MIWQCEIRPGPEFLLRKYFFKRTSFIAHQYYYADEECIKPVYSIVAKGSYHLQQESWRVPGGLEARHRVSEVYVIPYHHHVADHFYRLLKRFCPAMKPKLTTMEPLKKVKILQFPRYNKYLKSRRKHLMHDFDCSGLFNFTMNELQLIRLEINDNEWNDLEKNNSIDLKQDQHSQRELFLGDLHTKTKSRQSHRPTSYQTSLLDSKGLIVSWTLP
ncbi:hypothetical protein CHS0354_029760 [Potamilus streckersoni]|uniref:APCDD1 domain-containing protein n=1 Tax=Potamilus streckersoni TaxID=2493646 RepID=A0AAE0THX9_9BIVA|nr:hypothetical protein CHS0354_029760 [Potamilus streckersoni]